MRILVTGSNGLLGQKIVSQCLRRNIEFIATSKGENRSKNCPEHLYLELDITNTENIKKVYREFNPTHVIHTAAITNVDYCELNPSECDLVNVKAVSYLFEESKRIGAHFQLLSTDFVFNGETGNYKETDEPDPLSVYARSKVDAENILQKDEYKNWSIIRTIIVYGIGDNLSRNNIVSWAKEALSKGEEMRIVDDQFRAPTWADDLAWACLRVCELDQKGIFHICGPEIMSIYQIVEGVAKHFNYGTEKLIKVSSSELKQPAKRPPRTGFDLTKSRNFLGYSPKTLEETLDQI
jgi:dTDP-4-dehydrorhamnose reductase